MRGRCRRSNSSRVRKPGRGWRRCTATSSSCSRIPTSSSWPARPRCLPAPRSFLLDDVVAALAPGVEGGGVDDEERGLDRVAQLDEIARQPATAIEALNFLAQLDQDAP